MSPEHSHNPRSKDLEARPSASEVLFVLRAVAESQCEELEEKWQRLGVDEATLSVLLRAVEDLRKRVQESVKMLRA